MIDEKQQSLIEVKIDKIEEQVTKLVRQVEGDEQLGVMGLRADIRANEEWKRTTEHLLETRDRNIVIDFRTIWLLVIIVLLTIIILFFTWDFFRSSNFIADTGINDGLNNRLFYDFSLWY